MTKKNTFLLGIALLGFSTIHAQNVGIGTSTPIAKTHVNQTAGLEAILVDHTGNTGNSIQLVPTNAANASSTLWLRNSTIGAGINNQMLTTTSTASSIISTNLGLGLGLDIWQANTGASGSAIDITQEGTGAFSRGIDISMAAGNTAIGTTIFHSGTGGGNYTELINTANASAGSVLFHRGTGTGIYTEMVNTANNSTAHSIIHRTNGTGRGINISMASTTSTGLGIGLFHSGLGRGTNISLSNAANTEIGLAVFNSGTGDGVYSQAVGDGVVAFSTGITGTPGTFINSNTAANRNSLGLFVVYAGTAGGAAGGGNAAEIQHDGTNGNAVDIFMGDPSVAPGPGNTTSEYNTLSVSHYATGTSPTVGLSKSAASFTNNSADPSVMVFNNGTNDGDGMYVQTTAVADNFTTGVYSQSTGTNRGVGLWAVGNRFGIIGDDLGGAGYGLFSNTDFGAVGVKSFMIDHPLDPANKTLRHFCIESDEVLNLYRGVVSLDANGQAIVELPDYYAAANINPSYQLTAIGTATQPYILSEIDNNQFIIAGAPNTKVSWTVYAQRNDPTIQYFISTGTDYSSPVSVKSAEEKGKYFTPEAFGQDKTQSIFYNAERVKNFEEREAFAKQQQKMTSSKSSTNLSQISDLENTSEKPVQKAPKKEKTTETISGR